MLKIIAKVFILSIFIIVYKYNYEICEYKYPKPEDEKLWTVLRMQIYAFMYCLPLLANIIKVENKIIIIYEYIVFGIMTSDAFAFIVLNETEFGFTDVIGITLSVIFGYYKIYNVRNTGIKD